jgi:hypothetical protein
VRLSLRFLIVLPYLNKPRYWALKNAWSIDALPGMKRALDAGRREKVAPIKKMIGPFAPEHIRRLSAQSYRLEHVVLVAILFFLLGIGAVLYGHTVAERVVVAFPTLRKADTIPFFSGVVQ